MSSTQEYTLSLTIEDLVSSLGDNVKDTTSLRRANISLTHTLRERYYQQLEYVGFGRGSSDFFRESVRDMGTFLITNASDSIIQRYSCAEAGYVAVVRMALRHHEETLDFEIEDNGIGIDSQVEPLLFKEFIDSGKASHQFLNGQLGIDMIKLFQIARGWHGKPRYVNKGQNVGAIFGYTIQISKDERKS